MLRSLIVTVAAVVAAPFLSPAGPAVAETVSGPVLHTGQQLVAGRVLQDQLQTASHRFTLRLFASDLQLDESEELGARYGGMGMTVFHWTALGSRNRPNDRTTLTMQRDGNLVLRQADGHVLLATGTTGSHNYAQLLESGALVVRNGSGHTLWSSHTSAVYLVAGQSVPSGRRLISRARDGFPTVRLVMAGSGDLQLTVSGRQVWHSGSHVAGSTARFTASGRLVVVTPRGRVVWSSPAQGAGSYAHITQDGRLVVKQIQAQRCWTRPSYRSGADCFAG